MAKLKPGAIGDLKPVRLTIELPAARPRPLAYAEVLARETAQETIEPAKLSRRCSVASWRARAFAKARRIT